MERSVAKVSPTQEERTSATRARLIEATLDILLSKGYAAATTVDIAARAGLTRGALAHHFESKDKLVVEAVDHLLKTTTGEIRVYASPQSSPHFSSLVCLPCEYALKLPKSAMLMSFRGQSADLA